MATDRINRNSLYMHSIWTLSAYLTTCYIMVMRQGVAVSLVHSYRACTSFGQVSHGLRRHCPVDISVSRYLQAQRKIKAICPHNNIADRYFITDIQELS